MASSVIGRLSAILELNSSQFHAGMNRAQKRITSFRRNIDRVGNQVAKRLALPLAVAGGAMVKAAGDLESGMIGVQKTTGLADKEILKLKRSIVDFSAANAVTISSLQETAKVAGQMGITGARAIGQFTEAFAMLERASDQTVRGELGAQTFAKFLDLTGQGTEAAEEMGSALVYLGNTSKTTEGKILATANEIAKGTVQFQLGSANILGIATALDEAGVQSEVARTAMQSFFTEVDKASKSGSESLSTFAKVLDTTNQEVSSLLENDPSELLLRFAEGLQRMNEQGEDTATVLDDLGLGAKRYSLILQVLAARNEKVRQKVEDANQAQRENTALAAENAAAQRGLWSALTRVWNAVTGLSSALGEGGMLGGLTAAANGTRDFLVEMTYMIREVNDAEKEVRRFAETNVEVGKTLGDVIAQVVDIYRTGFGVIGSAFQILGKTLGAGGAQIIALFQGRFEDIKRIGEAWSEDMSQIFENTLNIDTTKFEDALERIKGKIEKMKMADALDDLADSLLNALPGMKSFAGATEDAADNVDELRSGINGLANDTGVLTGQYSRLGTVSREAAIAARGVSGELANAGRKAQIMNENMTEFNDALVETEQQIKNQQRIWDNLIEGVQDSWVVFFEDVFHGKGISSIKDFLGRVKDLFLRVIAEIAAAWTASKIFGGTFNLGNISFGSGGGLVNTVVNKGITEAFKTSEVGKSISQWVGGLFGSSGISGASVTGGAAGAGLGGGTASAGISGVSVTGGASGAGLGGGSAASTGALASGGIAAGIFAAGVLAIKALRGGSARDRLVKEIAQNGFAGMGPLGTRVGAGDRYGFAAGANTGFAADFAQSQGIQAGRLKDRGQQTGVASFRGLGVDELNGVLAAAEQQFESLKRIGADLFRDMGKDAKGMGDILRDGLVKQSELAELGMKGVIGTLTETKSGVEVLGEISAVKFGEIIRAVANGKLSLEALRGETVFNQQEMQFLGDIGVDVAEGIRDGFSEATLQSGESIRSLRDIGVRAMQDIADAAGEASSAMSGVGGGGDPNSGGTLREIRDEQRRGNQADRFGNGSIPRRGGGGL